LEKQTLRGRYSNSLVIGAGSQFGLRACSQANDLSKFRDDIAIIAPVYDYEDSAGNGVENMNYGQTRIECQNTHFAIYLFTLQLLQKHFYADKHRAHRKKAPLLSVYDGIF
jgi:hypothetical protein